MLKITNLKLDYRHTDKQLLSAAAGVLHVDPQQVKGLEIVRRSLDCRKKPDLSYVYTLHVSCSKSLEKNILRKRRKNVSEAEEEPYSFHADGTEKLLAPPVIVGCGPAGLFCGLELARHGYRPILIDQGKPAQERKKDVERFWNGGPLLEHSNVQFGEGGAGAFSDGKLNTLVKERGGRNRKVLDEFIHFGADEDIRIDAKPHIGTDRLLRILEKMRMEILSYGGIFHYETKLEGLSRKTDDIFRLSLSEGRELAAGAVVLAIGNGARDTLPMLLETGLPMEQKPFAVGLRIEHPQEFIDRNAYGRTAQEAGLSPSPYKVTAKTPMGRGVYSFCMCPGGYVINASSQKEALVVNGMSYHDRGSGNANSAIVVTVSEKDFGGSSPLAGSLFQESLEKKAYRLAGGKIPQQYLGDFLEGKSSASSPKGGFSSCTKGAAEFCSLKGLFPEEIEEALKCGLAQFGKEIPGFDRADAILSGVESRTSSPVRIPRDGRMESVMRGIYPCGEGAGYAGGIVSAGMDGLKCAQAIAHRFAPEDPIQG